MDLTRLFTIIESLTHQALDNLLPILTRDYAASRWFGFLCFLVVACICAMWSVYYNKAAMALKEKAAKTTAAEHATGRWGYSTKEYMVARAEAEAGDDEKIMSHILFVVSVALVLVAIPIGMSAANASANALNTLLGR